MGALEPKAHDGAPCGSIVDGLEGLNVRLSIQRRRTNTSLPPSSGCMSLRSSAPDCAALIEGQKVSFDTQQDRRTGKIAVANIQAA
jgi:hypothetical protein